MAAAAHEDESSSSYFEEYQFTDNIDDDDEDHNKWPNDDDDLKDEHEDVGSLLQACQLADDKDHGGQLEEITIGDDEYSEYTLKSNTGDTLQDRSERSIHKSFSTIEEEDDTSGDEDSTEEFVYEQSSSGYSEEEDFDSNNGDENEQEESVTDEDRSAFQRTPSWDLHQPNDVEQDRIQREEITHVFKNEHVQRSEAFHDEGDHGDLEEQNEKSRFVNHEKEALVKDERNGVYYQGRSIGSAIIVSACLGLTILVFLAGFLSAFWSNARAAQPLSHTAAVTPTLIPTPRPSLKPTLSPSTASPITIPPSRNPTRNIPALDQAIGRLTGQTQRTSRSQEQAFDWIVNVDAQQLASDDPGLVQRFILATMYFSADSWSGEAWLVNSTTCDWAGVDCDETGQVSHLNLTNFGISSSIPTELQLLTSLRELDLSHNNFVGPILDPLSILPSSRRLQYGNIMQKYVSALQLIDLSYNNLDGTIPASLGRMSNLMVVDLSNNSLNGTIPVSIGDLPNLIVLDVANNTLDGELPTFREGNLSIIDASGNEIRDNLDETFCKGPLLETAFLAVDCDKVQCRCCAACSFPPSNSSFFAKDKATIDSVCGREGLRQDGGERCEAQCAQLFFECCNPFYEMVSSVDSLSITADDMDFAPRNMTFLHAYMSSNISSQCRFEDEAMGCLKFAKCQALTKQIEPAPENLPALCAIERLERDSDGCMVLCRKVECCYSPGSDNCLTENFDVCLDYAPCQNLRFLNDTYPSVVVLPTAPFGLEFDCFKEQPACREACAAASCCASSSNSSCFQSNFISCLTYSVCTIGTEIKIDIPARFSHVPNPSTVAVGNCNTTDANTEAISNNSRCIEHCEASSCCFDTSEANCFHDDPLGCLTWSRFCSSSLVAHDTVPSILANDTISSIEANGSIPSILANDTILISIEANDSVPSILTNDTIPSIVANDIIPSIEANATMPSMGANDAVPSNTTVPYFLANDTIQVPMPNIFNYSADEINAACSRASTNLDGGQLCKELCEPDFSMFCRPFQAVANVSDETLHGSETANFVDHVESCVKYAKCHAVIDGALHKPAPASLTSLCSMEQIRVEPESCKALCRPVECCFSSLGDNCLVDMFDACLDYAPCQNLRVLDIDETSNSTNTTDSIVIPAAQCLDGLDTCGCEHATCCAQGEGSCLRSNFVACLTYASCPQSDAVFSLPPPFELAPLIPSDVDTACKQQNETSIDLLPTDYSCDEYCEMVSCCFVDGANSCFDKDPMGCLEWYKYCQKSLL